MRQFPPLAAAVFAAGLPALLWAAPLVLLLATGASQAQQLRVEQITDNTYAIIGPLGQRNPENLANNATFGLIVTSDGAVLVDPGGSYKGRRRWMR